ncbi:hypothetical protein [Paraclostridium bifermentans]|uniref:hypothetical protein n=1 Tax=Paraclostridium bifermentans TaxID=1490 RepID=UPI0011DC7CE9|nr:hypothetical protein [Paraclostridium bifermentans]
MINRFFDIDNNVYLNSYYIYILMLDYQFEIDINELIVKLYLLKYPKKLINILKDKGIKIEDDLLKDYQINNIQSNMLKYSSTVYVDGFNEAISYLYSKEIIDYNISEGTIFKGTFYNYIVKENVDKNLINISKYINSITDIYGIEFIKQYL